MNEMSKVPAVDVSTVPISADSHIVEPPHCHVDFIDPAYRDRAPHIIDHEESDGDKCLIEGFPNPIGLNSLAAADKAPEDSALRANASPNCDLWAYLGLIEQSGLPWTVSVWGGDIFDTPLPQLAIEQVGHALVGIEPYFHPQRQLDNEEMIGRVVEMVKKAGVRVA